VACGHLGERCGFSAAVSPSVTWENAVRSRLPLQGAGRRPFGVVDGLEGALRRVDISAETTIIE